jgi:pimeloyl-ACP methyl ester carboxylesterase
MGKPERNLATDLRGASRMAVNAITGITSLIEALHAAIDKKYTRSAGRVVGGAIDGVKDAVYQSIRGVTRGIGTGLDRALGAIGQALGQSDSSPIRESMVAALNGVLGDYLASSGNSLAITMHMRRDGETLALTRDGLIEAIAVPSAKVVVLVHGLCMNDLRWNRKGHDHGAALERDLSYTAVYLRYNSGLHVSANGRELASMLETLVAAWPVSIAELSIVAHSMGGLVARSAYRYASIAGCSWPHKLRKMVFLGTPHDGVPLERVGHWLELLWDKTPYTAPFGRLGKLRSAGITDLRYGFLVDEDWQGRDRFAKDAGPRSPQALPEGVMCFAIAATLGRAKAPLRDRLIGDGLVPVPSALGQHSDPRLTLALPASHQRIVYRANHLDLLSRLAVYRQIRSWLASTEGG